MFRHEHKIPTDLGDKDHILYLKTNLSDDERLYSLGKIEDGFFTIRSNKPIDNFPSLDTLEFISALKHDEYENELNKIELCKENIFRYKKTDITYANTKYYMWRTYDNLFNDFIFIISESLDPNVVVLNPINRNNVYYASKQNIYLSQIDIKIIIKREHPYEHQNIDKLFNISYSYLIKKSSLKYVISKLFDINIHIQLRKICQNIYKYKNISIYQLIKIIQFHYFIRRTCDDIKDINEIQDKIMYFFNFMNELKN